MIPLLIIYPYKKEKKCTNWNLEVLCSKFNSTTSPWPTKYCTTNVDYLFYFQLSFEVKKLSLTIEMLSCEKNCCCKNYYENYYACNIFFFFFYNFECPDQRSIDIHTLTNFKGTCNTLLVRVPR